MLKTRLPSHMSPPVRNAVVTKVYAEPPGSRGFAGATDDGEGWHHAIEGQLLDWDMRAEEFEEEGIEPPSRATLALARCNSPFMRAADVFTTASTASA